MNAPTRRVAAAALLAAGLACGRGEVPADRASLPEIPAVDLAAMEAPVAQSIERARAAAEAEPGSASRWGELGMVFHAHGLHRQAAAAYSRAESLAAEDHRWPYLQGVALEREDAEAAIAAFERAERRRPPSDAFYVRFGDLLARTGDPEGAARRFRAALDIDPRSSHALYGLAGLALARDELTQARDLLLEAERIAPSQGEVHTRLAQVFQRLGEPQAAASQEVLARAYPGTTRPHDPVVAEMEERGVSSRAHNQRGLRLAELGRFEEAEREFRRVLEIRPGNARDYANLGGALARQGKSEAAVEAYLQALAIDPGDPAALNNLAMTEADRGDMAAAERRLREALRIDPLYAEAHHNLGLVRARAGRPAEAIEHYRRALELDPGMPDALQNLGTALASTGRMTEAVESWREALRLQPTNLSALYNLTLARIRSGDHREAIDLLRRGVEVAPNSSRLVLLLAWELATAPAADLRRGEEAVALARRVHEAYPRDPRAADVLAAALAEAGDLEAARELAETALRLARAAGQAAAADEIERRLGGYREGSAYRQRTPPSP